MVRHCSSVCTLTACTYHRCHPKPAGQPEWGHSQTRIWLVLEPILGNYARLLCRRSTHVEFARRTWTTRRSTFFPLLLPASSFPKLILLLLFLQRVCCWRFFLSNSLNFLSSLLALPRDIRFLFYWTWKAERQKARIPQQHEKRTEKICVT